jgi:glucosamine--fructose-6-phosphate aminotransferase (isomerizing)
VALVGPEGLALRRAAGKLVNLEAAILKQPVDGVYGLGHTRWATHGRPTEENAHPHRDCTGRIVVVHNGIIENYLELKRALQAEGHVFATETDTEIVAHLVEREMGDDGLENAVRRALKDIRGMFALVLLSVEDPEKLVAARNGPPVVVGLGQDEFLVASDVPVVARLRVRWSRIPCASPTSIRCSTTCCSNASSTPSGSRCPILTSTSACVGAVR